MATTFMVSILVMRLSEEAVIEGAGLDIEYSQRNILYQTERNEFSFTTNPDAVFDDMWTCLTIEH